MGPIQACRLWTKRLEKYRHWTRAPLISDIYQQGYWMVPLQLCCSHIPLFSKAEEKLEPRLGTRSFGNAENRKGVWWHYFEDSRSAHSWPIKWQFCQKAVFQATPSSEVHCFTCTDCASDWLGSPPPPPPLSVAYCSSKTGSISGSYVRTCEAVGETEITPEFTQLFLWPCGGWLNLGHS